MYLEAAWLMVRKGAELYDSGLACGAEANSAKFLGARAGHAACWQAIATLGGFGYARESHVERLYREVAITRLAPITDQLILSRSEEHTSELPSPMRMSYAGFCLTKHNDQNYTSYRRQAASA